MGGRKDIDTLSSRHNLHQNYNLSGIISATRFTMVTFQLETHWQE